MAKELVDDRLAKGLSSDYEFVFLKLPPPAAFLGYACYGRIPCTLASYDIYWIVVAPDIQGQGIGRMILAEAESLIRAAGGTRMYVDTSESPKYRATRAFYRQCGYACESIPADFYAPGDGKVIFVKRL
ncbi:MAG: GNAT family N-acetyltransferase [Desulfobacterales bacterium]